MKDLVFQAKSPRAASEPGPLERTSTAVREGRGPGRDPHTFQLSRARVGGRGRRGGPERTRALAWPCPRDPRARASVLGAGEEQPPARVSSARTRKEPRLPPRGRSSAASGDGCLRESRWTPRRLPSSSQGQGPDGRVRPPPTHPAPVAQGSQPRACARRAFLPGQRRGRWRTSGAQAVFDPLPRVCLEVDQRLVVAGDPPALSSPPPVQRGDPTPPGQVSRGLAVAPGSPGGVGPRRGRSGVSRGRRVGATRVTCPGAKAESPPADLPLSPTARRVEGA
ncbi:unnamed protein product [Rangifer tarandus platyrhynchus]|uniref:Uncharacterized protein n=1 Tax=Rangifer tarandus platyrhynchus TaxID=3082113 RepID=A0ABN8XUZ2_RANTA|nr:unnamed protein product [Rangifer tarandus platyrhynchus]